eukprot:CAMPEP_0177500666 /NCGR_PEP_ID=MMETSP0369-20130122/36794_1 /TAXON_ID=447022 ORGANISM="Scrippsiella hangoei-like, Strain SHHI-4" /NCGR_SAMPLE_ID=MMETSP0369 /ASSEMBLY_ACC=CAM_ASM_000364 /LENGTH=55 /DNA_ID=CAMNT_0018978083 /DNA_START=107 /DNA_END=271 /DNA_ORIENTATION=+
MPETAKGELPRRKRPTALAAEANKANNPAAEAKQAAEADKANHPKWIPFVVLKPL